MSGDAPRENGLIWELVQLSYREKQVVRALCSSLNLPEGPDVWSSAIFIVALFESGREAQRPNSADVSSARTKWELGMFYYLTGALDPFIEDDLHRPAIDILKANGLDFGELEDFLWGQSHGGVLGRANEIAGYVLGPQPYHAGPKGQPRKHAAEAVTAALADMYEQHTGKRPTFTSDPQTGQASGPWPDTLAAVLKALSVRASVHALVRAYAKRRFGN